MLGDRLRLLITREPSSRHENARIDKEYFQAHAATFEQNFYVCGPKKMVKDLSSILRELGVKAENIITEISIPRLRKLTHKVEAKPKG